MEQWPVGQVQLAGAGRVARGDDRVHQLLLLRVEAARNRARQMPGAIAVRFRCTLRPAGPGGVFPGWRRYRQVGSRPSEPAHGLHTVGPASGLSPGQHGRHADAQPVRQLAGLAAQLQSHLVEAAVLLLTEDPQAAQQFYRELFGWRFTTDKYTPDYIVIYNGDKPIGGIVPHKDKDPNIQESMWLVSLSVADVDRAVSAVKARQGEVLDGPADVRGRGRMAVVRDAEGAELVLIRAAGGDPPDGGVKTGEWLWVDLFTKDAQKALDFYGAVAGYNTQTIPTADEDFIILLRRSGRAYAGVVKLQWDEVEPNWLPYIKVDDLEGTISKAEMLGGILLLRTQDVAIIADPTGGVFGIQTVGGK